MDFLANYYVKSNFLPIANCIGNRIGEGEDYTCDNSVAKNFLDTAAEEPYNLFQTVEQHKNDIIDYKSEISQLQDSALFKKVKKYENEIKNLKKKIYKLENDLEVSYGVNKALQDFVDKVTANKDTFINIPKKSNGVAYVIFFILALVLFRKLKK